VPAIGLALGIPFPSPALRLPATPNCYPSILIRFWFDSPSIRFRLFAPRHPLPALGRRRAYFPLAAPGRARSDWRFAALPVGLCWFNQQSAACPIRAAPSSRIESHTQLNSFFRFCNERRPHSAFGNEHPRSPLEVYREGIRLAINQ